MQGRAQVGQQADPRVDSENATSHAHTEAGAAENENMHAKQGCSFGESTRSDVFHPINIRSRGTKVLLTPALGEWGEGNRTLRACDCNILEQGVLKTSLHLPKECSIRPENDHVDRGQRRSVYTCQRRGE